MDTTAPEDSVLTQLRKLREGVGLTPARLEQTGSVMSALGTSDPQEGYERLCDALGKLDDSERLRALRLDYGLDLAALLGREPVSREREWLGERRSGYAVVLKRDVKTLSRWSDKAVAELQAALLNDTFTGDLYVVANVRGDRILGTSLIQQPLEATKDGITERSSMEIKNSSTEPSMPCLIYAFPRDWEPATLTLAVAFHAEPYPTYVWGTYSDNILKLPHGAQRYPIVLSNGVANCTFKKPRRELIYGVWWIY